MKIFSKNNTLPIIIHILSWLIILFFPLLFLAKNAAGEIFWGQYFAHSVIPLTLIVAFYINYCLLVPKLYLKKKYVWFFVINILLSVGLAFFLYKWHNIIDTKYLFIGNPGISANPNTDISTAPSPARPPEINHVFSKNTSFIIRDFLSIILCIMLSIFIKMSANWKKAQASLKEAEKMRVEAELKNLKNQINPHFLLNTLNNVYSLIEFDKEKAQEAIQDLSKMLRYILYNQRDYVSIHEEVGFIMNYVKLMKIRLTDNNEIITDISVSESSTTQVTPLLFISLVENAFKHGISATDKGFIHISISEPESGIISCVISNSYHPKSDSDKSGSGIGLEQVSKRLELMYPNKYIWNNYITDNGATYVSNLTLYK